MANISGPVVKTTAGPVRGVGREGSFAFLGIPFAEPPVGALRFRAPLAAAPWDGVRDTSRYGATPQRVTLQQVTRIPEPSIAGESTLNVNVFSPSPAPGAGLPVVAWIHGGGYVAGSPSSPWYDGRRFNRDGVVTVSISYRLGFDGYGWIEDAPLNRGVLDQIAALEWVQENIEQFGGDPARVTIAGQSAGADAVMTLLTSPRAQHLFSSAISHSAASAPEQISTAGLAPQATARLRGERFARQQHIPPTRRGFSTLAESTLLAAQFESYGGAQLGESEAMFVTRRIFDGDGSLLGFRPEVDGDVVTMSPYDAIASGIGSDKPLLAGSTTEEFVPAIGTDSASAELGEADFDRLRRAGAPDALVARFRERHPTDSAERIAGRIATEYIFGRPLDRYMRGRAATAASPSWMFQFAWVSPALGVSAHCVDLPFAWDLLDAQGVTEALGEHPPQQLADEMHGAWVQFITEGTVDWPPYTSHSPRGRVFDAAPRTVFETLDLVAG
ncbi:MAG: carboxylesterase/lipase family protein [Rhodoglobus sp.]